MLTVMCPNCRYRFPAPGCCNLEAPGTIVAIDADEKGTTMLEKSEAPRKENAFFGGGYLLVPREYTENNRACFINAPTIIHGPTIIQQPSIFNNIGTQIQDNENWLKSFHYQQQLQQQQQQQQVERNLSKMEGILDMDEGSKGTTRINDFSNCHIDTTCDLTGGTVTITTPNIQSGGCLIRNNDTEMFVQSPRIEIRPKLSVGGGYFVQKYLPVELTGNGCFIYQENDSNDESSSSSSYSTSDNSLDKSMTNENLETFYIWPPSGCQELPGTRRSESTTNNVTYNPRLQHPTNETSCNKSSEEPRSSERFTESNNSNKPHSNCCCSEKNNKESSSFSATNTESYSTRCNNSSPREHVEGTKTKCCNDASPPPMEIRVNATVQLPPNVEHCTVNITATTGHSGSNNSAIIVPSPGAKRDNFNGGGLVHLENNNERNTNNSNNERRENSPTTPLSWLAPCPWNFDNYSIDQDFFMLTRVKRILEISGWYHEGLSWQQSETLLKNTPVGRWLMRDSSDSRFAFAVSVQTPRGPTSVRVHYFLGRFRLDAQPRLSLAMPLFEDPVKMLQYYVDYSKRIDEHRKEVLVDYSGQLYGQIYLTKPLVKEVQSLSHLARIAVNTHRLNTHLLPPLIKNYLAEYPYSL